MTQAQPPAQRRPAAVDLFAGAGGFSLGLEQAGFDVALAVDNDPLAIMTYRYNSPQTRIEALDLADCTPAMLRRLVSSDIELVVGGPSCQGFSEIGKRDPTDPRNGLVPKFIELAVGLEPQAILMENVPGLAHPKNRSVLDLALTMLAAAGYTVAADMPEIIDSAKWGLPQRRKRLFLLAFKSGVGDGEARLGELRAEPVSVAEAFQALPDASDYPPLYQLDEVLIGQEGWSVDVASAYAKSLRTSQQGLAGERVGYEPNLLTNSALTRHRVDVIRRFERTSQGSVEPISRLPRLEASGFSPTLRAGTGRDHGSHTSARPIHPDRPRVITGREAARLHSFPDWYRFHTTRWHAFRQIGNAVPPIIARTLGQFLIDQLELPKLPGSPSQLGDKDDLSLSLTRAAKELSVPLSALPEDVRRRPEAAEAR